MTNSKAPNTVQRYDATVESLRATYVADTTQPVRNQGKSVDKMQDNVPTAYMQQLAFKNADRITDTKNMLAVLPDLELAIQILVSSILSPNDMMSTELTFACKDSRLGDLTGPLIAKIKAHFETVYKIESELELWLRQALFETGSYAMAIIPENSVDAVINNTERLATESLSEIFDQDSARPKSLGILGSNAEKSEGALDKRHVFAIALESDDAFGVRALEVDTEVNTEFNVTDNYNVLKLPWLHRRVIQDKLAQAYSNVSMEWYGNAPTAQSPASLSSDLNFNKTRTYSHEPTVILNTINELDKDSVGHPIVMRIPSEAVIPVHTPGNPSGHIGYFIVLDNNGNPVNYAESSDYWNELKGRADGLQSTNSEFIELVKNRLQGTETSTLSPDEMTRVYGRIVERDLTTRLKNGVYGENVAIASPQEIYRIMLARALARKQTQLVYIPASMFTYIAFDYDEFGIGESLLSKTQIAGNNRTILTFTNMMAAINNSVTHKDVNIELDPNDPDPSKTVSFLQHEYARGRGASFPLGTANPTTIVDFLQKAGVSWSFSGHPAFPTTKLDVSERSSNNVTIPQELQDYFRDIQLMGMGIPPEAVDTSKNAEFATTVIANNIVSAKRAMQKQKRFNQFITTHVQKYIANDKVLMDGLATEIEANRDLLVKENISPETPISRIITHFINHLDITLPEPNMARYKMQMDSLDQYSQLLEKALENIISTELYTAENSGWSQEIIDNLIAVVKARYLRNFMTQNNIMPELTELFTITNDAPNFPVLEEHTAFIESLSKTIKPYLEKVYNIAQKNADRTEEIKPDIDGSSSYSSSNSSSDSSSSGDDFGGGGDDFMGDFGGGGDTPEGDNEANYMGDGTGSENNPEEDEPDDKKDNTSAMF